MPSYGVTDKGFVLKRLDTIIEEVHGELTEGFGFDTRLQDSSFLNVLVTSFCGQIADLWETAQDSYYAKYPATATGLSLDHAVQFGGITRVAKRRSCYPLHCTGDDGTVVEKETIVATATKPEIQLYSAQEFTITREEFNQVLIKIATTEADSVYSVTINGDQYSFSSNSKDETVIFKGIKNAIVNVDYQIEVKITEDGAVLSICDTEMYRKNMLLLSDNLTTQSVTVIANFYTMDYGKITIPKGIVTKMVNNVPGFNSVTNVLEPLYGRDNETDIELRQSYAAKSALRSNTMIDSIVAELTSNVANIETASGYENDTDYTDKYGRPPHSVEIVVEGGDKSDIASAILKKKAGGIQTYGNICINVPGKYGDLIPVRFNRPEYMYVWLKAILIGNKDEIPVAYATIVQTSVMEQTKNMVAGDSLLTQILYEGIYNTVAGLKYIDIYVASSNNKSYVPAPDDYKKDNIMVTQRQKYCLMLQGLRWC